MRVSLVSFDSGFGEGVHGLSAHGPAPCLMDAMREGDRAAAEEGDAPPSLLEGRQRQGTNASAFEEATMIT